MTIALIDGDLELVKYWIDSNGYATVSVGNQNQQSLHRWIAEKSLGRQLTSEEQVHHVNSNKLDNRRQNLVICPNDSYHSLLHARQRIQDLGFNPNTHHYCSQCKTCHPRELFPKNKNSWSGLHNMCKESSNAKRRGQGYGKFNWKERMQQQYRRAMKKGQVFSLDQGGNGQ